jgi:hypothetical protein
MASASPASNPNDDVGYQVVIATIVSMILAIGAVILRFWSRRIVGVGFALDDYFAATSLFFKLGIDLTGFISTSVISRSSLSFTYLPIQ